MILVEQPVQPQHNRCCTLTGLWTLGDLETGKLGNPDNYRDIINSLYHFVFYYNIYFTDK